MQRIDPGEPGIFVVQPDGRFVDHHGGPGFDTKGWWFTPETLNRGISWSMRQRYSGGSVANLGRFTIGRTISQADGVTVSKTPDE